MDNKREHYRNCTALYCVQKHKIHTYEQFLQVYLLVYVQFIVLASTHVSYVQTVLQLHLCFFLYYFLFLSRLVVIRSASNYVKTT